MISSYAQLPDFDFGASDTKSNILPGVYSYHDAVGIILYGITGGDSADITIEVNWEQNADASSPNWMPLVDAAGNAILAPVLGTARVYQEPVYAGSMRLSRAATGTATKFKVNKNWTAGC